MKTITRAEPVQYGPNKEHTMTQDGFVLFILNGDARFNADGVGIRSGWRIEQAFRAAPEGDVALEEADHARLKEAAEKPSAGYPLSPARSCLPFVEAIVNAK